MCTSRSRCTSIGQSKAWERWKLRVWNRAAIDSLCLFDAPPRALWIFRSVILQAAAASAARHHGKHSLHLFLTLPQCSCSVFAEKLEEKQVEEEWHKEDEGGRKKREGKSPFSWWQACYWMRLQPSEMLTARASSVWYGIWIHGIFGHVVSISKAYLCLLCAGYAALIGAILSFSRGFWLTVFGFMSSSMVLDSCVKVRCLVLCIGKCLGRRCRSVIEIAVSFSLAPHLLVGGNS
jgi:hypothetical protein